MTAFVLDIFPEGKQAGKHLSEENTCNSSKAGIGKSEGDKNACKDIDGSDTHSLFQYL